MLKNLAFIVIAVTLCAIPHFAQNSNSSTTKVRPRTTDTKAVPTQTPKPPITAKPATTTRGSGRTRGSSAAARTQPPASESVRAAFDALLEGIRHANVNAVTSIYWTSPRLVLFNNNGTV